ncbi:Cation/H+ exchanger, partial [Dimargaris cristalligena]
MTSSLVLAVPTNIIPAMLGGFIIIYGLVSMFIKERLFLSEALVATLYGIIIGPICIGLVDPSNLFDIDSFTKEFARYVIALQVMAAGIELPKAYVFKEWKSLFMLLLPVMGCMWVISGIIIHLVFQLPWLDSLVVAACITPTDPILANSVIKGRFAEKRVPKNLRNILAAESGSNDGLGFPLLYLALYLLIYPDNTGKAIGKWFYMAWAYEVLLSVVIGSVVGYGARKLLYLAEGRCLIDKESFLSYSIALTIFLLGVVGLIASDDLLSVFCAGTAFAWDDWFRKETKEAHLQEVIDMLFNVTFFIYFGTIIPWNMFNIPSMNLHLWRFFVTAICVLIFRRLPILIALCKFIPAVKTWREAIFAGWFGPIGVGALYYIMVARSYMESHQINPPAYDVIYPIVTFVVMSSVLVHGVTIPLFHLGSRINT